VTHREKARASAIPDAGRTMRNFEHVAKVVQSIAGKEP
jgi:hypothetical protein